MAREYICLYHSYRDAIQALDDAERGRLLTAMLEYTLTGDAGPLCGNERFVFPLIKSQIDRDNAKYQEICKKRAQSGKIGGRPAKQKKANAFSESKTSQDKGEYKDKSQGKDEYEGEEESKDKDENKNKEEEKREGEGECKEKEKAPETPEGVQSAHRFHPPTLSEVRDYVLERNSPVDPQGFLDFYQAKGWMVGSTPMQDWKVALRNAESWERWQRKPGAYGATEEPDPYESGETLWPF